MIVSSKAQLEKDKVDEQIEKQKKNIDYNTIAITIEDLIQQIRPQSSENTQESKIYLPNDQDKLIWSEERQSQFIESMMLGLPINPVFIAENKQKEIIDGVQRIKTLSRFIYNELVLSQLKVLTSLNNFNFQDLSLFQQRKFKYKTIKIIIFFHTNTEMRRYIFKRLNHK